MSCYSSIKSKPFYATIYYDGVMPSTAFERQLKHVAVPSNPSNRSDTPHIQLDDYTALWFGRQLRNWAHYEAATEDDADIATALAERIDTVVREREESSVTLYLHTDTAYAVCQNTIDATYDDGTTTPTVLADDIEIALIDCGIQYDG